MQGGALITPKDCTKCAQVGLKSNLLLIFKRRKVFVFQQVKRSRLLAQGAGFVHF